MVDFHLSYRLSYQSYYFNYSLKFLDILIIDYLIDIFYIIDILLFEYKIGTSSVFPIEDDSISISSEDTQSTLNEFDKIYLMIPQKKYFIYFINLFPIEFIGYLANYKYYSWLRLNRLIKIFSFPKYWSNLLSSFQQANIQISGGWARLVLIFLLELIFYHVCGCIFFYLAYNSLHQGNSVNWLVVNGDAEITDNGTIQYFQSLGHMYLKSLYFSVQVLLGVGFGDIVAYNIRETIFTILLCYLAVVFSQSTGANLALILTNEDNARSTYIDKSNKFAKFAQLRNLSKRIKFQCQAFYTHQYSILHGLDEQKLISELPTSIQLSIINMTAKVYLKKVKALETLPDYVLSTIATELQIETFLPGDEIVAAGSIAQGLYIVSSGVVMRRTFDILKPNPISTTITSATGITPTNNDFTPVETDPITLPQSVALLEGDCFGENSLFEPYNFSRTYQAKSFCELYFVSTIAFKKSCLLHMTQEELDNYHKSKIKNSRTSVIVQNPTEINDVAGNVSDDEKESDSEKEPNTQQENDVNDEEKDKIAPMKMPSTLLKSVYNIAIGQKNIDNNISNNNNNNKGGKIQMNSVPKRQTITYQLSDSVFDTSEDDNSPMGNDSNKQRKIERQNMIRDILSPDSIWMKSWDLLLTFAVIFYSFSIPLHLSCYLSDNIFKYNLVTFVLAYISDVIIFLNFIGEISLFPFVRGGVTYYKKNDIWINYIHNRNIYIEILSLLPYDLIALAVGTKYLPFLRLSKLYHILHIQRYCNTINSISISLGIGQLLSLLFFLYIFIHWFGCLFVLAARVSTIVYNAETNWIITDKNSELWNYNYNNNLSGTLLYFRSIYWTLATTAGIGYWDILPTNYIEMFAAILIMIFGCPLLKAFSGGITGSIFAYLADRVQFQMKLKSINAIALRNDVSKETRDRIHYFYEYSWDRNKGVDEATVLLNLPPALRKLVINEIAGSVLRKIPFFQECSDQALHSILGLLKPRVFLDGDNIVRAGEYGMDFFVIESGSVKITASDKSIVYTVLGPGDYLGESCLLGRQVIKRSASAYSSGYTYAYSLKNIDFLNAIEAYPEEGRVIVQKIRSVLNSKIAKNATINNTKSKSNLNQIDKLNIDIDHNTFYHPESYGRKLWSTLLLIITIYNMIIIPLRIAIEFTPYLFILDYSFDLILFINLYLIYFKFYTIRSGILITNTNEIQSIFFQENFSKNLIAYIPFDIIVIFLLKQKFEYILWAMKVIRITKIFLLFELTQNFNSFEEILSYIKISYVGSRMLRMILCLCLLAHWMACIFYILPYLFNINTAHNCINEPDALYGNACEYKGTWIQMQIMTDKLPKDGGNNWTRYIRALNWSLPLLTLQVIDDVFPINNLEFMYGLFALFIGITVEASIFASTISLVIEEPESADIQIVRKFLEEKNVDIDLRLRVLSYLNFLNSSYARTIIEEEIINSELPYSLQISIIEKTKLQLLNKCPLFDTCSDESKINLCFALTQQIYSDGDYIIKFGDMGHEMFFLAEGSVQVCSDSGTIYTTLHAGSYFGETGLVFSDKRMSNIRAIGICVCYCLNRIHLDNELKASSENDARSAFSTLKTLLEKNQRTNQAITKNLNKAKVHNSKLSKLIGNEENTIENKFFRALRNPYSNYCIIWDTIGLIALLYYSLSIPFHIAFLHGKLVQEYMPYLPIDFIFDLYWLIDIYFKSKYFSILSTTGKYDSDSHHIWQKYYSSYSFHYDCISSLPLEIFAVIPGLPPITLHIFRLIHLIRIRMLFQQINKIHKHLEYFEFRIKRTIIKVITAILFYFLCNHWLSCGFFIIHRYVEWNYSMTWAIGDNLAEYNEESGKHNICSESIFHCYSRAIYFVISTMSTVGFGDVCQRTNIEFLYQIFIVSLCGVSLNGLVGSSFRELWYSYDNASQFAYQKHLKSIDHYIKYRKLSQKERNSIIGNFQYLWETERQSGGYETNFMSKLPPSLAGEVALVLRADIIESVHVFRYLSPRRIARALRPQLIQSETTIYSRGDIGDEIYFILSGSVKKYLDDSAKNEISRVMYIERNKHAYLRGSYYRGCHFGEMCLLSQHTRRESTAISETESQVYTLNKYSLWEVFKYMTRLDQRIFLIHLYTEVNGYSHTLFNEDNIHAKLMARTITSTIDNLYSLADGVMNEIMDEGIRAGKIPASIKSVNDTFIKIQPNINSTSLLDCPWFEVLQVYEQKKVEVLTNLVVGSDKLSSANHSVSHVSEHGGSESGLTINSNEKINQINHGNNNNNNNTNNNISTTNGLTEERIITRALSSNNDLFYQKLSRKESKRVNFENLNGNSSRDFDNRSTKHDDTHSNHSNHSNINSDNESDKPVLDISTGSSAIFAEEGLTIDETLRARVTDLFQFMDVNDDGEVSREQLMDTLQTLGWETVTWDIVDKLIAEADKNGNNRVVCEGIIEAVLNALGQPSIRRESSSPMLL